MHHAHALVCVHGMLPPLNLPTTCSGSHVQASGLAPYRVAVCGVGAVSVEEARRRCPGLQVLPMRTDRYRSVSDDILAALRAFAADRVVQRQGYDDFYLDVSAACAQPGGAGGRDGTPGSQPVAPPRCRVALPASGVCP